MGSIRFKGHPNVDKIVENLHWTLRIMLSGEISFCALQEKCIFSFERLYPSPFEKVVKFLFCRPQRPNEWNMVLLFFSGDRETFMYRYPGSKQEEARETSSFNFCPCYWQETKSAVYHFHCFGLFLFSYATCHTIIIKNALERCMWNEANARLSAYFFEANWYSIMENAQIWKRFSCRVGAIPL